jgi:O-antigen ligase
VASYLLACIVFGGSAQNPWANLGLQLVGIGLIAWAAIGAKEGEQRNISAINVLVISALLLVIVQLVPLPPNVWSRLPARDEIVRGLSLLGYPLQPFPVAEMPQEAVLALFSAIPAIATFVTVDRLSASPRYIAGAIVAGMVASIFLGAIQVVSGPDSWAYFYKIHNPGSTGFFANVNHMGTLLLIAIPMAATLVISARSKAPSSPVTKYALGLAIITLIGIGIFLNGSRAALGLSVPVVLASAGLFRITFRWRGLLLIMSLISLIVGVALMIRNPIAQAEVSPGEISSVGIRAEVWRSTIRAIGDNFPVGTGLGSFSRVYHRYENPDQVTPLYVNHAHNDYLEIALELGLGGVLLIMLFLSWWMKVAARIWISAQSSSFRRAATIATGVVLVHSGVDFPIRTAAISSIFAACVAVMARRTDTSSGTFSSRRHVVLT